MPYEILRRLKHSSYSSTFMYLIFLDAIHEIHAGNLQIFFLSPLPSTYHSSVISPSLNAKSGQRHVKLPRINEVGQGSISSAHKPFKRNLFTTNPNLIMSWQTSKSYMSYLHIEQYFHHWISNIRSTASWTQIPKRELPSQLWRPREL